jgi:glycosyltransferase involved in cell wall biosynthesis
VINVLELEASKGWGGQEKRTVRVVNALDKSRFRVFYGVHADSALMKHKEEIDATMLELPITKSYNPFELYRVIKAIKKHNIHIISTHSGKDAWIGAIAGKLTGAKVVRVRHLLTPINSPASYNMSSRVTAIGEAVADYLISAGVKKEKIDIIHTGRDMDKYSPRVSYSLRDELNISEDALLIGIVAVLRAAKRHSILLEALEKLPEGVKLVIVGDGPQEENIRKMIDNLCLKNRVYMLGHREDVADILPSLDLFVMPSSQEALGSSIIEASACEVPVVVSRVGGMPEVVLDGESGYIFEPDSVDSLVEKLQLLVESKQKRVEFGKKGREYVVEKFSIEDMIQKTERQYETLVKSM